jgi:hypothetical protein
MAIDEDTLTLHASVGKYRIEISIVKEANKATVRRFFDDLWNKKNISIIDELIPNTYVDHTPPPHAEDIDLQGPEVLKQVFAGLQDEFADIHVSIGDQIEEEDKVVTPVTWQFQFTAGSNDAPIPSQVITIMGVSIDRIDSGKIAESWNTFDVPFRLINQLGMLDPVPKRPLPGPVPCPCPSGYVCQTGFCMRG